MLRFEYSLVVISWNVAYFDLTSILNEEFGRYLEGVLIFRFVWQYKPIISSDIMYKRLSRTYSLAYFSFFIQPIYGIQIELNEPNGFQPQFLFYFFYGIHSRYLRFRQMTW